MPTIKFGETTLDVLKKDIKNVHLSVYPPSGKVRISAPNRMNLETIRLFAISKIGWIRKQQKRVREQERESQREFLNRESHYVWGQRYMMMVIEEESSPSVQIKHETLLLSVRPGANRAMKREVMAGWYRQLVREAVPPLIKIWEPRLGVRVEKLYIQRMKTKWGSCNMKAHTIRLNTELAKKPKECLEYVIVHEMVHLLVINHGSGFIELMDRHIPYWRHTRELLNRLPVRHERWNY